MVNDIIPIDQLPGFTKHLGKARTDRIRYVSVANPERAPRCTNIENTLLEPMQRWSPDNPSCPVNDILVGAARAENVGDKPLSVSRLYNMLQCMEVINTREVMAMMNINQRQAQRYVRAIKTMYPFLQRALQPTEH